MSQQPQPNPDEVAAAQQRLAANQARLAELRRQQQQQSGQAPAAPPSAAAGGHPPPTYGYEDDEDDDDDFDEDDMEEEPESDNEFNDMIAEQSNASAAGNPLPVHFDDEAVLTACKYGDLGTLKHFQSSGTLKADSIRDNRGRSALHYAVDSGAVDLCEHLLTLGLSPTLADESGITPRDIASILQLPLVSAVLGGDGREASSLSLAPPRLVMSKPAPKQSSHAVRSTWGLAAAAPAGAVFALSELGDNSVTTPAVANNCIAWNPLVDGSNASDYGTLDGHARSHVLTVANQEGTILGTADFLPLGRLCIKGTTRPEPFYTVASVRAMKGALSALIRSAGVTMDKCDVAFVSSKNLTPTLRPACYFRWFTRVLHPLRIFAAGAEAINEVFPSYKTYLDTAKADLVRKHAWYAPTTPRTWRMAVPDDLAGLAIVSRATSFDISVEITEVALRHFAEQSSHLGLFVTGEEGAPEAGFLLQSRTSAHGQYQIGLVFAVLGKVSAAEICDAVAVIAPHIEVVLCTNVCGLTEDDLRASKFAELEGAGQYLYLANSLKGTFCFDVKPSRVRVPITP